MLLHCFFVHLQKHRAGNLTNMANGWALLAGTRFLCNSVSRFLVLIFVPNSIIEILCLTLHLESSVKIPLWSFCICEGFWTLRSSERLCSAPQLVGSLGSNDHVVGFLRCQEAESVYCKMLGFVETSSSLSIVGCLVKQEESK